MDFCTPENASHSFALIEQLRRLPQPQLPAEDRLQVKNVVFHSVKNALAVINEEQDVKGEAGEAVKVEKKEKEEKEGEVAEAVKVKEEEKEKAN